MEKTSPKIRILLIEDDHRDARLVGEVLRQAGNGQFSLKTASTLNNGLEQLSEHTYDVVLLDLSLPDSFGLSTIDELLQQKPDQPIIVLTGAQDEQLALEAGQRGAQDYLVKSEIPGGVLPRSILYAIERKQAELRLRRTVEALREANQKILEQQKSVIEEERLEVLLQIAGATSHELNQPLMALLGSIELLRLDAEDPEQVSQHIDRIEGSGRRIAEIVKKMSALRQVETKPSAGGGAIITLDHKIRILYVEDTDEDYKAFEAYLAGQENIELTRADSLDSAESILAKEKYDLIFVDYLLPEGTGLDFLQWTGKKALDTPVIAVTGYGDEVIATNMIKSGAYDYLPKPSIDHSVLSRCIFKALEKYKLKKEVEASNARIARMATRDLLTGLYNRHSMNDLLETEFKRARRYGTDLACLLLDLDFFKEVNDTFGHRVGDQVLQQFGKKLTQNLRDSDLCFRYGGEEFVVLLPNANSQAARQVAEKIRRACESEKYSDGDLSVPVTVSLGVASTADSNPSDARDLLTLADKALYRAKAEGRNRVVVYQKDLWTANLDKTFGYLKERITAVLGKTKKAAVDSLELMVWGSGGDQFKTHNRRVIQCLNLISDKLGFNQATIKTLQNAAIFHDATKFLLGAIDKKGALKEAEMVHIFEHPYKLSELIEPFDFFAGERSVLLWHHENWDGSGYPEGLKADEIPVGARIFAIVDAFVAMTSQRSYRRNLTVGEAVLELNAFAGTQFDPALVEVFIDAVKGSDLFEPADEKKPALKSVIGADHHQDMIGGGFETRQEAPDFHRHE